MICEKCLKENGKDYLFKNNQDYVCEKCSIKNLRITKQEVKCDICELSLSGYIYYKFKDKRFCEYCYGKFKRIKEEKK